MDEGQGVADLRPLGPWLVTKDEIKDVQNLDMFLDLNGKRVQTGSTNHGFWCRASCRLYFAVHAA